MSYSFVIKADHETLRFGKIDMTHCHSEVCPIDSNAHAYYIFNTGYSSFIMANNFMNRSVKHFCIKILDESALDLTSIEVPLYISNGGARDRISAIKATTYNAFGDQIVESKMSKDAIIYDEKSDGVTLVKFSLPNVRVGSVIEVKYTVVSPFLNITPWFFQSNIPVLKSLFTVNIPSYFNFKQFSHGYIDVKVDKYSRNKSFSVGGHPQTTVVKCSDYSAENIPAFPKYEHLIYPQKYISNIEFELATFIVPGFTYKDFTSTWSKVKSNLLKHSNFGERFENTRCFKTVADSIALDAPYASMVSAFNYIKRNTQWDEYASCITSQSFKATLDKNRGNCADINLSLVALLRRLDLEAYPVALSLRGSGFVNKSFASSRDLNFIVAYCIIDGKTYLMDATSDFATVNVLPDRCLNGEGLVIDKRGKETWVSLQGDAVYYESHSYMLDLDASGLLWGYHIVKLDSYAAFNGRSHISDCSDDVKYIESLEDLNVGLLIDDYSINHIDSLTKKLILKMEVKIDDHVSVVNDLIYMKPLLYEGWYENPLKLAERLYPVEYMYPLNSSSVIHIKVPEGYAVESLPSSGVYKSQDGSCSLVYSTDVTRDIVSVVSKIIRDKTVYPYTDYKNLKAFYEQVVIKHNEQVVFKRI